MTWPDLFSPGTFAVQRGVHGEWVNSRTKIPVIVVWHATKLPFDDHDAARDAQVVEGRSQRREVVLQALVVPLAPVRSVEPELRRKVVVDLRFVLAGQLFLADADEPADEFLASHSCDHRRSFAVRHTRSSGVVASRRKGTASTIDAASV
jgi:hypothetical protein